MNSIATLHIIDLCNGFSDYHRLFYKHAVDLNSYNEDKDSYLRVLAISERGASRALDDATFFRELHKTLVAWQMNRGIAGGALYSRSTIQESMQKVRDSIAAIEKYKITDLDLDQHKGLFNHIQTAMWGIEVTRAKSKIVAHSKALHFLLPALIPPIDRRYTLRFFYDSEFIPDEIESQKSYFEETYRYFVQIAKVKKADIEKVVKKKHLPFSTNEAKVIDNAIIGYCLEKKLVERKGGRLSHP